MDLNDEQQRVAARVLREAGFSAAWILDSDDQSEIVFLVPKNEEDFSSIDCASNLARFQVSVPLREGFVAELVPPGGPPKRVQ